MCLLPTRWHCLNIHGLTRGRISVPITEEGEDDAELQVQDVSGHNSHHSSEEETHSWDEHENSSQQSEDTEASDEEYLDMVEDHKMDHADIKSAFHIALTSPNVWSTGTAVLQPWIPSTNLKQLRYTVVGSWSWLL